MNWLKENWTGIGVWALLIGGGVWFFAGNNSSDPSSSSNYNRFDDPSTTRSYEEYGDKDCADFSSQSEAQEFFEEQGGPDEDFHNLDRDGDGVVCESLK